MQFKKIKEKFEESLKQIKSTLYYYLNLFLIYFWSEARRIICATYNTALLTQKLIYCFINKRTHYLQCLEWDHRLRFRKGLDELMEERSGMAIYRINS